LNRACSRIDLPIREGKAALVLIGASVGENQIESQFGEFASSAARQA
jgi:hypothetical protein